MKAYRVLLVGLFISVTSTAWSAKKQTCKEVFRSQLSRHMSEGRALIAQNGRNPELAAQIRQVVTQLYEIDSSDSLLVEAMNVARALMPQREKEKKKWSVSRERIQAPLMVYFPEEELFRNTEIAAYADNLLLGDRVTSRIYGFLIRIEQTPHAEAQWPSHIVLADTFVDTTIRAVKQEIARQRRSQQFFDYLFKEAAFFWPPKEGQTIIFMVSNRSWATHGLSHSKLDVESIGLVAAGVNPHHADLATIIHSVLSEKGLASNSRAP